MEVTSDLDTLHVTITAHECFRAVRGDVIEFSGRVGQGLNRLVLRNESPSGAEDLRSMKFAMRHWQRQAARHRASLWGRDHPAFVQKSRRAILVCPTVGDSSHRLVDLLTALRQSTDFEFHIPIVVGDDGAGFEDEKRHVATMFRCWYATSEEPGISGAINTAVKLYADTYEFIIVLDDGAIPHRNWLSSLPAILDSIPPDVVMVGCSHANDWQLAIGGMLGSKWPLRDWCNRPYGIGDLMCSHFYGTIAHDQRVELNQIVRSVAEGPPLPDAAVPNDEVRDFIRYNLTGSVDGDMHRFERQCRECKYIFRDRWPESKQPLRECWSPGAQGLIIRREFLDRVGGCTHNCSSYEQLLAVKAAEAGYRVMYADCPPFAHFPSLGFVELQEQKAVRPPMRSIGDVCQELWGEQDPFKVIDGFISKRSVTDG